MTTTLDTPPTASPDAPTGRLQHAGRPAAAAPAAPAQDLPPGRYVLVCRSDQVEVVMLGEVTHVGRGLTADVRLDDHLVSRRHAVIVRRGAQTHLIDDRSANGMLLNGRAVGDAVLRHGDVIVLGRSVLRYLEYRR